MFGNIVVGMIGGVVGNGFFRTLDVYAGGGWLGSLIVATVGAVVVLFQASGYDQESLITQSAWAISQCISPTGEARARAPVTDQ